MFLRLAWRLLSTLLLLAGLVFFMALAIGLRQKGGLGALPSAVPTATGFTADYLRALGRRELGMMASGHRTVPGMPVAAELCRALPKSLGLLAVALALAALVGLTLGMGAAYRWATSLSDLLLFASVLGVSTPSFFAAMLLIWLAVWLYPTTSVRFLPISGFGWDAHLILPTLVLAARPATSSTRLGYNVLAEAPPGSPAASAAQCGGSPC